MADQQAHSRPDTAVDEKSADVGFKPTTSPPSITGTVSRPETAHDPSGGTPPIMDEKAQIAAAAVDSTAKRKSWFRKGKGTDEPKSAVAEDHPKEVAFTSLFRCVIMLSCLSK